MRRWTLVDVWIIAALPLMLVSLILLLVAIIIGQGRDQQVIAYVSAPHNTPYRIFLMDINAGLSAKANDVWAASSCCLAWSPDGRQLVFPGRGETGFAFLYLMDVDGRNPHRLFQSSDWLDQGSPRWSSDGSMLAFTAFQGNNQKTLLLLDMQTGDARPLSTSQVYNSSPAWSPDMSRLMFAANLPNVPYYQIMMVKPDGSDQNSLTPGFWDDLAPEYSPDGRRVVFVSTRVATNRQQIYVMNADGSVPTRLTNTRSSEYDPHWSPDGQHILFTSTRTGSQVLFLINPDGSNEQALTSPHFDSWGGVWSPDGTQILFASSRDGNAELYVINADGTGERRLTYNTWIDSYAVWQPDGT